ncbi:DUF2480 family protein [Namhaeicola litoreus]|uniref:DUF2480 family protein n=1 Tax=Namhaeicola litoreus TaxID=1052145 RepID=A0ABW3Y1S1_9FLAO
MAEEILNRVANSALVTIDLEDFYPEGNRFQIDLKDWLFEEQILIEKDFRQKLAEHDWNQYQHAFVAIQCSVDAIIPSWAYLLVTTYLEPFAKKVVVGDLNLLETVLFTEIISNFSVDYVQDKPVILKGCSEKPIPDSAYTLLIQKLKPVVRSLMYGEACSNVPLYKKNKTT